MILTHENYHSIEANNEFLGTSQIKSFVDCEEKALAELRGEHQREVTKSMLVGSYVDAHFGKGLDLFKAQNPDIFTQKGTLRSEFKKAEEIIERIERDEYFMKFISGEQQVIKTGKIFGQDFKIMIDFLHPQKMIVDLKIMRDFELQWKAGMKLSFIEYWMYDLQAMIYQAVEGNNLPFFIAGATKETTPDIGLFHIPQSRIDMLKGWLEEHIQRIVDLKTGKEKPTRCEKCDYCKHTKKLTGAVNYEEFFGKYNIDN